MNTEFKNEIMFEKSVEVLSLKGNWENIRFTEQEFIERLYEEWRKKGGHPKDVVEHFGWAYPLRIRESVNWNFMQPIEFIAE